MIKLLLEKGANAKAATRNGVNGVMMAANVGTREEDMTGRNKTQREAIETIGLLLAAGADINAADTQGRTAAHGAALWGLTDVVRFLHKNGAEFDVKDKRGFTALDTALGQAGGFGFDQHRPWCRKKPPRHQRADRCAAAGCGQCHGRTCRRPGQRALGAVGSGGHRPRGDEVR